MLIFKTTYDDALAVYRKDFLLGYIHYDKTITFRTWKYLLEDSYITMDEMLEIVERSKLPCKNI